MDTNKKTILNNEAFKEVSGMKKMKKKKKTLTYGDEI